MPSVPPPAAPAPSSRVEFIDVFRGLTMLAMVFVNDLGGPGQSDIVGFAPWLWHAMTPDTVYFADVVAPAFLFIIGVSIPLAIGNRLQRGEAPGKIWRHILTRTVSLLIIGIAMGNMRGGRLTMHPLGMSGELWTVLLLLSFILIWTRYPESTGPRQKLFLALRLGGVALLAGLFAIYREGPALTWIQCRWYVIGTIGWAYLISALGYFLFRRRPEALVAGVALLILLAVGDRQGAFDQFHFLDGLRRYLPFGVLLGVHPAMTLSGVVIGLLFTREIPITEARKRIAWMLIFSAGLFFAGFLLRPLYGSSKLTTTPTWALYSTAWSCVAFAALYALAEANLLGRWRQFLIPVGKNPLLPYFLSFMLHPLMQVLGIHGLNDYFHTGWIGVIRTVFVALLLVQLSNWLTTRGRIVLKL
ncbi:MAG: DUF5009 domain-containing protein [Opitutae bacterium]|nr:DUF5009 domain-containing protein [Opitutae bacterium]